MRAMIAVVLVAAVTCLTCGCGTSTTDTRDTAPSTSAQCTEAHNDHTGDAGRFVTSQECEVKLKDGRKLDCVTLHSDISCDWAHVSGADKEE